MTVGELIVLLSQYDSNEEVFINNMNWSGDTEIDNIGIRDEGIVLESEG